MKKLLVILTALLLCASCACADAAPSGLLICDICGSEMSLYKTFNDYCKAICDECHVVQVYYHEFTAPCPYCGRILEDGLVKDPEYTLSIDATTLTVNLKTFAAVLSGADNAIEALDAQMENAPEGVQCLAYRIAGASESPLAKDVLVLLFIQNNQVIPQLDTPLTLSVPFATADRLFFLATEPLTVSVRSAAGLLTLVADRSGAYVE